MKVREAISTVDRLKPNAYEDSDKLSWLNEIEQKIYNDIINRKDGEEETFTPYVTSDTQAGSETELKVPEPYSNMYVTYLSSKIDYHNQDFGLYNNSASLFNSLFDEYAAYYRRNNPAKRHSNYDYSF